MSKTAIITGICGQDGAYLAQLLLEKEYNVIGWARRNKTTDNLDKLGITSKVTIKDVDICDNFHVADEIYKSKPQEIYNLAAQSHVGQSFYNPMLTCQVNYGGYLNILLAARKFAPSCKIYQAGTSEMFGYSADTICNEQTPFAPMSPYAISKVAAYWAGVNARFEAEQFVCNGILFNHESPLRGNDFVTKKITNFVKNYKEGDLLHLGNLDASRDWGHAKDYVKAMYLMMQQPSPNDFVVATGQSMTVRQFIVEAFKAIGKDITFNGSGINEIGYISDSPAIIVDEQFYRPNDLRFLKGSPKKAMQLLNWKPEISLPQMIEEMVKS